jgi:hypothetical protein
MSELDKLILITAAAMIVLCLVGPSAVWRITKSLCEGLLIIAVLVWVL